MKILVIGNSHSAALRNGWKGVSKNFPDLELEFFSASADVLASAQIKGGRYGYHGDAENAPFGWKKTKERFGSFNVDLTKVSAVIFGGLNLGEVINIRLLNRFSIDDLTKIPGRPHMSKEAYSAFCNAIIENAISQSPLMRWTERPVYMVPQPRRSESVAGSTAVPDQPWAEFMDGPVIGCETLNLFYETAEKLIAKSGHSLICPPENIYGDSGLILEQFRQTQKVFPDGQQDHTHMNGHYGARVLVKSLRAIQAHMLEKEQGQ